MTERYRFIQLYDVMFIEKHTDSMVIRKRSVNMLVYARTLRNSSCEIDTHKKTHTRKEGAYELTRIHMHTIKLFIHPKHKTFPHSVVNGVFFPHAIAACELSVFEMRMRRNMMIVHNTVDIVSFFHNYYI